MDDTPSVTDTPAYRVYLIRKELERDPRKALAGRPFAELLNAKAQELGLDLTYNSSAITRIEKGERILTIEDTKVIASVDPLGRGPAWLAWGDARQRPDARLLESRSDPDPPLNGIGGVKHPPQKPHGPIDIPRGGKHDRPIKKKPPP